MSAVFIVLPHGDICTCVLKSTEQFLYFDKKSWSSWQILSDFVKTCIECRALMSPSNRREVGRSVNKPSIFQSI